MPRINYLNSLGKRYFDASHSQQVSSAFQLPITLEMLSFIHGTIGVPLVKVAKYQHCGVLDCVVAYCNFVMLDVILLLIFCC